MVLTWANEASDSYINADEKTSINPVAYLTGTYGSVSYSALLDETTAQTCDESKTYDQTDIPTISSVEQDGFYSICAKLEDNNGNTLYVKSSTTLVRDVVAPSVIAGVVIDSAGIFADGNLTAAEFNAGTNVVTTDIIAVGADIIGYSFVANGDSLVL